MTTSLTKQLTKLDMLIIRACKSANPEQRLKSVYRRFWLKGTEKDMYNCLIPRLVGYCLYGKTSPLEMVCMSRPRWFEGGSNYSWEETTYKNLVAEVRLTIAVNFPQEMIWPKRWR